MTFGLVNTTKKVVVKVGLFGVDFVFGFVEEITLNATQAKPANAMDVIPTLAIPDSQSLIKNLIKKSAYATGAALTSSVVKDRIVQIISGATFTGLL